MKTQRRPRLPKHAQAPPPVNPAYEEAQAEYRRRYGGIEASQPAPLPPWDERFEREWQQVIRMAHYLIVDRWEQTGGRLTFDAWLALALLRRLQTQEAQLDFYRQAGAAGNARKGAVERDSETRG